MSRLSFLRIICLNFVFSFRLFTPSLNEVFFNLPFTVRLERPGTFLFNRVRSLLAGPCLVREFIRSLVIRVESGKFLLEIIVF